jgi:alanine racemase
MAGGLAGGVFEIDLDALAANWRALGTRLAPGAACAAVVKADGYGLGAGPVARRLFAEGCRDFFVATPEEGLALRGLADRARLYVLAGVDAASAAELAETGLLPVLNHLGQLEAWRVAARRRGGALPAALHLDSGMNRLGFPAEEVERLAAEPGRLDGIALRLVMSHLVSAEEADNPLNPAQRARFLAAVERLAPALGRPPLSLANSSGIFLGPDYHFAMVRPGVAVYGVNPTPEHPNPMAEVVRLTGKILQVRRVDRGETVGYGATFRAARPSRLATVAVGYADGLLRSASNRASARLGGVSAPLVGRVSMDLITLDVTDLPEALAAPGGAAVLIGGELTLERVAEAAGTIPYEILTALGARYERRYAGLVP